MRVSVIGLGAVGAVYGARLAANPEVELRVVADGERAERLRREGMVVDGAQFRPRVVSPAESVEPADVLLLATKHGAFAQALADVAGHVGPGTIAISVLNGITSEAEFATAYPQARVLLCVAVGIDAVRQGNRVSFGSPGRLVFGEARNVLPFSGDVRRVAALFDACGIAYEIPGDMVHELWWKFMVNVGVNQVSAVLAAPYGLLQQDGPAREVMFDAQREVIAVANAAGVELDEDDLDRWRGVLAALGPGQYTSMAQDVLAGRPTEVDIFGGQVRELGRRHGVDVPVNTVLHRLLKAREALAG